MTTFIAFLRGINVGRNKQLAMADLRAMLEALGYDSVKTHLRSGNVVFTGTDRSTDDVAKKVEKGITDHLGMDVRCVVRTADELRAVVDANPLKEVATDGAKHLVSFLAEPISRAEPLDRARLGELDPADYEPERFHLADREIYIWYANGIQASKLSHALLEKRLGLVMTTRNWNTVTKLLTIVDSVTPS